VPSRCSSSITGLPRQARLWAGTGGMVLVCTQHRRDRGTRALPTVSGKDLGVVDRLGVRVSAVVCVREAARSLWVWLGGVLCASDRQGQHALRRLCEQCVSSCHVHRLYSGWQADGWLTWPTPCLLSRPEVSTADSTCEAHLIGVSSVVGKRQAARHSAGSVGSGVL
jgi:hypothetical protein